jgi:hypothetical protein
MKPKSMEYAREYQGKALIADPIYQYASFTVSTPDFPDEKTEKDLIDSPWVQRLRRIYPWGPCMSPENSDDISIRA